MSIALDDAWKLWEEPPHRWAREALAALDACLPRNGQGDKVAGLLVAPTGAGKSRVQIALLWRVLQTLRPKRHVVVTVPKQRLVDQLVREISARLGPLHVAPYYGRGRAIAPVIVACQASLQHLADHLPDGHAVGLWMADEAHRSDTPEVWAAMERLKPWARIGVTATPYRAHATHPLKGWERVVYRYTMQEALADGVLVDWRPVYATQDERTMDVVDAAVALIRRAAPDGPGLFGARSIPEAERFAEAFTTAGIPTIAVHSKVPGGGEEVDRRLAALMAGAFRAVVHVDVLTEGVDLPGLRWLCPIAERSSDVAIVQELGRGLRKLWRPDRWGLKRELVVLLPRPTGAFAIAEALARDPNVTASHLTRVLEQRAEDELMRVRTSIKAEAPTPEVPRAEAAAEVGAWLRRLVEAVREAGVTVDRAMLGDEERQRPITDRQVAALKAHAESGHSHPKRYLGEPHRSAVGAACLAPYGLTVGQADALLRVLDGLRRHAGKHNAAHRHHPNPALRYWPGVRSLDGDAPALALRILAASTPGDRP